MKTYNAATPLVLLAGLAAAPAAFGQGISLSPPQRAQLARLVKDDTHDAGALFAALQAEADAALKDAPDPVKIIVSQGRLKSDPEKIRTVASLRDLRKLNALAWTYAVTNEAAYRNKIRDFVLAWAKINQPTGDPINETKLEPLFVAYDLVRSSIAEADKSVIDRWLRQMAAAEIKTGERKNTTTTKNNWQSHRLKVIGMIGFLLDDAALKKHALDGFRKQIGVNLRADGSSFDFHERDALHYHVYTLEPLLALAIAARQSGERADLYGYAAPSGASLARSIAFLAPYADGTKTHAEFTNSKVAFDRKRAEAGEAGFAMGSLFEPKKATLALEMAAFFEARLAPRARKLRGGAPSWQTVLNAARR